MRVAILKYNAGNTTSVAEAVRRLGAEPEITDSAEDISSADRVIIPGVGEAASAMQFLRQRNLDRVIASLARPVLGICLGMQLLCKSSAEGDVECIGVFSASVSLLPADSDVKIPHIGWNQIRVGKSPLFEGVKHDPFVYFAHSYAVTNCETAIAHCDYAGGFAAAIENSNFFGVQFHPEKSGSIGSQILENFMRL
jgi:glutamine amidotransferase